MRFLKWFGHHGRQERQPVLVSAAFFLFITADALCIPFLPVFADALYAAGSALPRDLALGLPISVFWLMVAVAQLTTGWWERGRDRRVLFLIAMGFSAGGLALAAVSTRIELLIFARGLSGFGYGAVMILAQDHLLRAMGERARTFASGVYLSLFFSGALVGTVIGGSAAQMLGFSGTLLVAAGGTVLTALLILGLRSIREPLPPQRLRPQEMVRNLRVMGLVLFAALPSRLINGGFVFFFVPLYLHGSGTDPATIGRVVMIYSLIMATTTIPWSRLVDRIGHPLAFTAAGVLLSGVAMLVLPVSGGGLGATVIAMIVLGMAQAIGMSPQVTVLFSVARAEIQRFGQTGVLGLYRVCERLGLVLGPLVLGWLVGWFGMDVALLALAGMMGLSIVLLLLIFGLTGRTPAEKETCGEPEHPV